MQINKNDILILLPAFNEAQVIGKVLEDLHKEGYFNICVVDDGSTDRTANIVQEYDVILLKHLINRGAGAAIQTGITYARSTTFQCVALIDSDGQHLPGDIVHLYQRMQESKSDIVIGNRFSDIDNSIPKIKIFYNRIANVFTNLFCENKYTDTQSGFRLLNKNAIEKLNLKNNGFGFCSEMIIISERLGLRLEEAPIQVLYTPYSMNKGQNLVVGVRTARSILWQVFFG